MFIKKRRLLIILVVFISIILSGCSAEKNFNSAVDNEYTQKFNNILVMFRTDSIRLTQEVEDNLVKELKNKDVNAIPSNKAIPLTKNYSENEMSTALYNFVEENSIDGILLVNTKNVNIETDQYNHTPNPNPDGNLAAFMEGYNSARDGKIYHKLDFDVEVNLFNTEKEGMAWKAESHFSDEDYSGENEMIKMFKNASEFLVKKLENDGLI